MIRYFLIRPCEKYVRRGNTNNVCFMLETGLEGLRNVTVKQSDNEKQFNDSILLDLITERK